MAPCPSNYVVKNTFIHQITTEENQTRVRCRRYSDPGLRAGIPDCAPADHMTPRSNTDPVDNARPASVNQTPNTEKSTNGEPTSEAIIATYSEASLPSEGSAGHAEGICKPCQWFWKPRSCRKGTSCDFCHLCDMQKSKQHMKEMRTEWRRKGETDLEVEVAVTATHDLESHTCNFLSMDRIVGRDPFEQQAVDHSALLDQFRAEDGESNREVRMKAPHLAPQFSDGGSSERSTQDTDKQSRTQSIVEEWPPVFRIDVDHDYAEFGATGMEMQTNASTGAAKHSAGMCRPCAWFWKPSSCSKGDLCEYCHLCDDGALKEMSKQRRRANRSRTKMGQMESTNAVGTGNADAMHLSSALAHQSQFATNWKPEYFTPGHADLSASSNDVASLQLHAEALQLEARAIRKKAQALRSRALTASGSAQ